MFHTVIHDNRMLEERAFYCFGVKEYLQNFLCFVLDRKRSGVIILIQISL